MIIERLYIKNFMAIKEVEFTLPTDKEALIILQGSNGEGKSSVFDAMAFALLGRRKGSSVKHFIRRGTDEFIIEVVMRAQPGGPLYEARIVCGHKSIPPVKKEIQYKGQTYRNSEYETFLRNEFDLPLIETVVFTFQGDNNITRFRPAQLRDMLKQVFRLSFDSEHHNISSTAKELQERTTSLGSSINSYLHSLSVLSQDTEIPSRPPSATILGAKKDQLQLLREELEKIEEKTAIVKKYERERAEVQRTIDVLLPSLKQSDQDRLQLQARLREIGEKVVRTKEDLEKLSGEVLSQDAVDHLAQQVLGIDSQLLTLEVERRELKRRQQLTQEEKCPTCHQELPEDWVAQKEEFDALIAALLKEHKEGAVTRGEIGNAIEVQKGMKRQLHSLEQLVDSLEASQSQLDTELSQKLESEWYQQTESALEGKQRELFTLSSELEQWQKTMDIDLEKEAMLRSDIVEGAADIAKLEAALVAFNAQRELREQAVKKKEILEQQVSHLRDQAREVEQQYALYQTAQRLLEKYLPIYGILTAGKRVLESMIQIIQPIFPEWDMRLVPCRDGVDFEYRKEGENEYSSVSMTSGFESALCSIAFKMSITAHYNLPVLILDEIDAAATDENSFKIFDSINQFKREYNIQHIWLISHKETVVNRLISEYGDSVQVYQVTGGEFTQAWFAADS